MSKFEFKRSVFKVGLCALLLADQLAMAAIMGQPAKTFQTPTFDFDFSSIQNQESAKSQVKDIKSSWGNFFSERPKPVFTDELTNVVKGS